MNLPRTKFADTNSLWRQFFHLVSEVWEVGKALLWSEYHRKFSPQTNYLCAGEELVDVQISAHTLRHILKDKYLVNMENCESYVFRKGQSRGYYKTKENDK